MPNLSALAHEYSFERQQESAAVGWNDCISVKVISLVLITTMCMFGRHLQKLKRS